MHPHDWTVSWDEKREYRPDVRAYEKVVKNKAVTVLDAVLFTDDDDAAGVDITEIMQEKL